MKSILIYLLLSFMLVFSNSTKPRIWRRIPKYVVDQRVMRLVLQPGWKWSQDIKPTVGTDSCKAKHLGVIVSGAVCAKHDDGTELTYRAGDAYSIEPGHDGWVVGDKPAVVYEFHGKWGE